MYVCGSVHFFIHVGVCQCWPASQWHWLACPVSGTGWARCMSGARQQSDRQGGDDHHREHMWRGGLWMQAQCIDGGLQALNKALLHHTFHLQCVTRSFVVAGGLVWPPWPAVAWPRLALLAI